MQTRYALALPHFARSILSTSNFTYCMQKGVIEMITPFFIFDSIRRINRLECVKSMLLLTIIYFFEGIKEDFKFCLAI